MHPRFYKLHPSVITQDIPPTTNNAMPSPWCLNVSPPTILPTSNAITLAIRLNWPLIPFPRNCVRFALADKSAKVEVITAVVNSGNPARFESTIYDPCPNANNARIINRSREVVSIGIAPVKMRDAAISTKRNESCSYLRKSILSILLQVDEFVVRRVR